MDLLLADLSILVISAGRAASSALLEKEMILRSRRGAVALFEYVPVISINHSRRGSLASSHHHEFHDVLSSYFWVAASLCVSDFVYIAFCINGAYENVVI